MRLSYRAHWALDTGTHFLNHGSFGATPRLVLQRQQELRDLMEAQPVDFMQRRLPGLLERARRRLADFIGADHEGLVFIPNATTAVNAVLRSLPLEAGDEVIVTDHNYGACLRVAEHVGRRSGATVRTVRIPLDTTDAEVLDLLESAVTPRTRLALIDHVASATALVFPVTAAVRMLDKQGVDTVIDGAHAPGMLPLDLEAIGAAYYAGNCHKWMCAPKGAGFLHVRADRRAEILPPVISHGFDGTDVALRDKFDWMGTVDPTAVLSVPTAIDTMEDIHPDGWSGIMQANRTLADEAAELLAAPEWVGAITPQPMRGSMVAFEVPSGYPTGARHDPLNDRLHERYRIEVPISAWPEAPQRLVRVSAQLYNTLDEYEALRDALAAELGAAEAPT